MEHMGMTTMKKMRKRNKLGLQKKNQRRKQKQRRNCRKVSQFQTNYHFPLEQAQDAEIKAIEDAIGKNKFTRDQILSYLANNKNEKDPRAAVIK